MRRDFRLLCLAALVAALTGRITNAQESEDAAADSSTAPAADATEEMEAAEETALAEWDRLIYVPFTEIQKVFNNQDASAVIPYAEYLQLLKAYLNRDTSADTSPEAIIARSSFDAAVENDVVRLNASLKIKVLRENGWARLPLNFGNAAIGKLTSDDEERVILKGAGDGKYELLLKGSGEIEVTLELLTTVRTSPENRSFELHCPSVGISELQLTIPEPDQSVEISPLQVMLPTDEPGDEETVVRASLGATNRFEVRWNPEAGSRPIMDLLTSVSNQTSVSIEPGLIQTTAVFDYEILRGELNELNVLVPLDDRIIDVVSTSGRIGAWKAEPKDSTHQRIRIELLTPATDRFQVEVQTERDADGDTIQLIGKTDDGQLKGIHADGVVREAGRMTLNTDASLTTVVKSQSGVKRINVGGGKGKTTSGQAWEFSGTTGTLIVQTKPVEPRLLVDQAARVTFDNDELRLITRLTYTVERAGIFELTLSYPKDLTIDTVRADGMSEFNVDKADSKLTLSLTQQRLGQINVDITAHKAFDASAEAATTEIPSITPEGVERENGSVHLYAPQFLDVITDEESLSGLFPTEEGSGRIGRAVRVSAWKYTQRPFTLKVRTTPRPAQMSASVATTANIDPAYVTVTSVLTYNIQNAGIDTFRVAVPDDIDHVNFAASGSNKIQQQEKSADADDGEFIWKLVLQDELTGRVTLTADWKIPLEQIDEENQEQTLSIKPIRILPPFTDEQDDKRRVSVTQTTGEIRLIRDESLSINGEGEGDTLEKIDVRELKLMEQLGYLAFRYYSQPTSVDVSIRRHEIHQVVETVVSRAAFEIVTDEQREGTYRCRMRIATSERQRLRIDLPSNAQLQSPLLNSDRTTFEAAEDVETENGWSAYYINVSREGTSDKEFLLTFQFRCPLVESGEYPYDGRGSLQILRLPQIGSGNGGTVVQETRVAVWCPKEISFVGEPDGWNISGRQTWSFWNPLVSPSSPAAVSALNSWVGSSGSAAEFAEQGNVTVYRALGRKSEIVLTWWNRPFLVGIISAGLLFAGFILRRTSWENRLTLVVVLCLAMALWSLQDASESMQFVSAGSLGILAVAGLWVVGLFLGQRNKPAETSDSDAPPPENPPSESVAPPEPAVGPDSGRMPQTSPEPPPPSDPASKRGTVTPAPGVVDDINRLMGGK